MEICPYPPWTPSLPAIQNNENGSLPWSTVCPIARCTAKCCWQDRRCKGVHRAHVLAGDSPDAYNDIEFPERVTPQSVEFTCSDGMVLLPAHSVTLLKV